MSPRHSNIGWTDFSGGDANFVIGCTPVSEGCTNCYARRWAQRWGRDFGVRTYPGKVARLATWQPKPPPEVGHYKRGPGSRPMCFLVDMGDLFHEDVPNAFISRVLLRLMRRPDIDWQILTKRPARLAEWLSRLTTIEHIWAGVTVESQRWVNRRIYYLEHIRPGVRFVSVEPMLGPVDLTPWLGDLDWVICGGESGPNRRPFDKAWARGLCDQCHEAGVPFFFKQGSALRPGEDDLLDGERIKEWPREGQNG